MRPLSLRQKRLVAAIYLVALLSAAGNYYLGWGIFGRADRLALSAMIFLAVVGMARFGPQMLEEIRAHQAAIRQEEDAAERTRDKSNDAAETEQLRRSIGMPSNTSLERARDE